MFITKLQSNNWNKVKEIYMEAFPKTERKPFICLKNSVRKEKAQIFVAQENDDVLGFIVCYVKNQLVMIDYLAVSSKIRSKGTGSQLLQYVLTNYCNYRIVLLIEELDEYAPNHLQRIARRNFYLKNGLHSTNLFINGASGKMEILSYGGDVTSNEFLTLFKYVLGSLFFKLSKTSVVSNSK